MILINESHVFLNLYLTCSIMRGISTTKKSLSISAAGSIRSQPCFLAVAVAAFFAVQNYHPCISLGSMYPTRMFTYLVRWHLLPQGGKQHLSQKYTCITCNDLLFKIVGGRKVVLPILEPLCSCGASSPHSPSPTYGR